MKGAYKAEVGGQHDTKGSYRCVWKWARQDSPGGLGAVNAQRRGYESKLGYEETQL